MEKEVSSSLKSFLVELAVYAALVTVYYFLVLHLLGGWLAGLFHHNRQFYAWLALFLIVAQGLVLETLTRWLLVWFTPQQSDE